MEKSMTKKEKKPLVAPMEIEEYVVSLKEIEEAMANQDALKYCRACDKYGVEPTDKPLYERGIVDSEFAEGKGLEKTVSKEELPQDKAKISVKIKSYEDAKDILRNYSTNEDYLKSLIAKYIPDKIREIDGMDLTDHLYYGRVIKGVAENIMKSKKE